MANMSYCMFRNTLKDLYDVRRALTEGRREPWEDFIAEMHEDEVEALKEMPKVMGDILRVIDDF